jgi:hypothetical protein
MMGTIAMLNKVCAKAKVSGQARRFKPAGGSLRLLAYRDGAC